MEQGGRIANRTGGRLEVFIENLLIENNYAHIDKKKFKPTVYLEQPIYTRQYYIGQSIYESNLFCDFIIYHPQKHPDCLIIESKWQQTGGSVDEKFPYVIMNINHKYPHETILLLDGGGYKKGAEKWLKSQVGGRLKHVFNMAQFQKWGNMGGL